MITNPWPCLGFNLAADLLLTFWWQQKSFRLNLTSAKYAAIAPNPPIPLFQMQNQLNF